MRSVLLTVAMLCVPAVASAGVCRHHGGWYPASNGCPCPECEAEGGVPAGYKWYNAHLAPTGTAVDNLADRPISRHTEQVYPQGGTLYRSPYVSGRYTFYPTPR